MLHTMMPRSSHSAPVPLHAVPSICTHGAICALYDCMKQLSNPPPPCGRYYASRMMPLYRARLLNATGSLGMTLPPLGSQDLLLIPSPQQCVALVAIGIFGPQAVSHQCDRRWKLAVTDGRALNVTGAPANSRDLAVCS